MCSNADIRHNGQTFVWLSLQAMAGIYIHIPFCKTKCHYCNFYSLASTRYFRQVIDAIVKEIALRKDFLNGAPVTTIYFGGGTPSLMQGAHLEKIMAACHTNFNVAANAEITLEANPDDLSQEKAGMLASSNINRLSVGVQSFHDNELHFLNRVHTSQKALQSIEEVQDAGFTQSHHRPYLWYSGKHSTVMARKSCHGCTPAGSTPFVLCPHRGAGHGIRPLYKKWQDAGA
ncbi:MAG: radical SAM protein [Bacteroidales bacterium]|nr:radical SAM protein [Bacteroidales bacterium]